MTKPIAFKPITVDFKADLQRRLEKAPDEHAAALLAAYDVLEAAYDEGLLDILHGMIASKDKIIVTLSRYASQPEGIAGIRNLLTAAKIPTELIADVFGFGEALAIRKEIVGVGIAITKVFVESAVQFVGAAFADDADDGAAAAVFGGVRAGDDFEFLQRVDGGAGDLRGQLLDVFGNGIVVDAVQQEIVFELAHAVDIESAGAARAGAAALIGVALPLHAGDEIHQIVPAAEQ